MYLDFYGLREKPFSLTLNPRFLFLSKNHKEAFAHLMYGINSRAGFILLTGDQGEHTRKLQELFREAGVYSREATGIYDDYTVSAVKKSQLLAGIDQDGLVGSQTLMVLYGSIGRFKLPRLRR